MSAPTNVIENISTCVVCQKPTEHLWKHGDPDSQHIDERVNRYICDDCFVCCEDCGKPACYLPNEDKEDDWDECRKCGFTLCGDCGGTDPENIICRRCVRPQSYEGTCGCCYKKRRIVDCLVSFQQFRCCRQCRKHNRVMYPCEIFGQKWKFRAIQTCRNDNVELFLFKGYKRKLYSRILVINGATYISYI